DPSRIYDDFDPKTTKFLNVKATGYQWYWGYEYAGGGENGEFGVAEEVSFDSIMLADDERGADDPRLLAVDNEMVVPVNTFVRLQVTAADVLHAFAMPSFGIKLDGVPGRLNETYFKAEREGLFYGQCSELCGKDHAFMPIAVRVVSEDQFRIWVAAAAEDVENANKALVGLIEAEKTNKVALR
ncbi:MAG TPA: cytochrome c oxidase subunit II, partial [Afifellaceae bacterium]|nr:cytochrome c oxidase subunit II [Afifellaceae bacterium]